MDNSLVRQTILVLCLTSRNNDDHKWVRVLSEEIHKNSRPSHLALSIMYKMYYIMVIIQAGMCKQFEI